MKVDPLFLSPDTQIALRIEELNEHYKTNILLSGEFYDLLSEKGQASVRQIDIVMIKEAERHHKQIWSFDMLKIDPLAEDDDDDDEMNMLNDKDANTKDRDIGQFILHEDFNDNNLDNIMSREERETQNNLSETSKVWVMDHDFLCIHRKRNEEFDARSQTRYHRPLARQFLLYEKPLVDWLF